MQTKQWSADRGQEYHQGNMIDEKLLRRITANPEIFGGKPIIRGMRISVEMISEPACPGREGGNYSCRLPRSGTGRSARLFGLRTCSYLT